MVAIEYVNIMRLVISLHTGRERERKYPERGGRDGRKGGGGSNNTIGSVCIW